MVTLGIDTRKAPCQSSSRMSLARAFSNVALVLAVMWNCLAAAFGLYTLRGAWTLAPHADLVVADAPRHLSGYLYFTVFGRTAIALLVGAVLFSTIVMWVRRHPGCDN